MKNLKTILVGLGFFLLCFVAASLWGDYKYRSGYDDALAGIKPDTTYIDKEIYIDKPVPAIQYRDTGRVVYVSVPDTSGNTTPVPLPVDVKQYAEPDLYELQISGIEPNLDWINVHQKTAYINIPVPEYKYPTFALSPAISANLFPGSFGIGGGLDVDYWYKRWQFSAEGGYAVNFTNTMNTGFYAKGTVKYNLILR